MAAGQIDFDRTLELLRQMYQEKIPFNKTLGLRIASLDGKKVCVQVDMRPELVGNYLQGILHGGVISAVLDTTGGMVASVEVLKKMADRPFEEIARRFSRIGTIDLRVDYLRPGRGRCFTATGSILRTGNKIAVTRMALHNDEQILTAVGTGTYIVG